MRLAIEFSGLNTFVHPRPGRPKGVPWARLAVLLLAGSEKKAGGAKSHQHNHRPVLAVRTRDIEAICHEGPGPHHTHPDAAGCTADQVIRLDGQEWAMWDLQNLTLHIAPYHLDGIGYRAARQPVPYPRTAREWTDVAYLPYIGEIAPRYLQLKPPKEVAARAIFGRGRFVCLPPSYWEEEDPCRYHQYGMKTPLAVTDRAEWHMHAYEELSIVLSPFVSGSSARRCLRLTGSSVRVFVSNFPTNTCGHEVDKNEKGHFAEPVPPRPDEAAHFAQFYDLAKKKLVRRNPRLGHAPGIEPVYCPPARYTAETKLLEALDNAR